MFALVQFLADNIKAIVPVTEIKNFNPDTFQECSHPVYEVFWKCNNVSGTGYYYAVVLLVAETREELRERKKIIKFLSLKKLRDLLGEIAPDENIKVLKSNKEKRGEIKAKQEKQTACEKDKYLDVINEKIEDNRKRSPSHEGRDASASKRRRKDTSISPNESSDGDDLVLKSELNRITADYKIVLRKLKMKEMSYTQLKKKCEKLEALNIDLQTQLLSLLKANRSAEYNPPPTQMLSQQVDTNKRGSCESTQKLLEKNQSNDDGGSAEYNPPPPQMLSPQVATNKKGSCESTQMLSEKYQSYDDEDLMGVLKEIPYPIDEPLSSTSFVTDLCDQEGVEINNREITSAPTLEGNPSSNERNVNLMQWENEQLNLAPEIRVSREQWEKILASKNLNLSRLGRNLAVTIWGSETLAQRSVTGAPCRRFKKAGCEAKTPLTPVKIDAVQNGIRFWLKDQGKEDGEVLRLTTPAIIRKILSDKIMDLRRREKNTLSKK